MPNFVFLLKQLLILVYFFLFISQLIGQGQSKIIHVDVISEIEKQYEFAKANGHTNSAIKALELLSRIRGTQEEKEDTTDPEKLEQDLADSAKICGKEFYMKIGKMAGFLDTHNKIDNIDNKENKQ